MKFRKRAIIIDAVQWWSHEEGQGNHHKVIEIKDVPYGVRKSNLKKFGWLETSCGGHRVRAGDWIIRNHNGEYSSCNPETFERLYEPDQSSDRDLPRSRPRERGAA